MAQMEVYKDFRFEAAHFLPNVHEKHPCRKMHGHSYRVTVYCKGELEKHTGWLIDFADIKKAFEPVLKQVDHQVLNDIEGLENPTCEELAIWVWNRLKPSLPLMNKVSVAETTSSGCTYEGN